MACCNLVYSGLLVDAFPQVCSCSGLPVIINKATLKILSNIMSICKLQNYLITKSTAEHIYTKKMLLLSKEVNQRELCKDRSRWRSIVSTYLVYVCKDQRQNILG